MRPELTEAPRRHKNPSCVQGRGAAMRRIIPGARFESRLHARENSSWCDLIGAEKLLRHLEACLQWLCVDKGEPVDWMVERAAAVLGCAQDLCCLRAQARLFGRGRCSIVTNGFSGQSTILSLRVVWTLSCRNLLLSAIHVRPHVVHSMVVRQKPSRVAGGSHWSAICHSMPIKVFHRLPTPMESARTAGRRPRSNPDGSSSCEQNNTSSAHFSRAHFILVHMHRMAQYVVARALQKERSSTDVTTCLIVRCLSTYSSLILSFECLYILSHLFTSSIQLIILHVVGTAEYKIPCAPAE